ncbi:MAG: 2-hydroxyacyl-CoA dehydratase family protein [Lachnospiraceae bacterium]|nr:2-hydroxyacyl-CoA dehydratase family protein [Lachnospiraceae bacterium]
MKFVDNIINKIDKKLERFDPLWQAENGKGGQRSRYKDKTGVAKYREWRGVKDTFYDYAAWLNNIKSMGIMVAKAPVRTVKGFLEYRWMGSYLGTFMFIDRLFEGYRGEELRIAHMNMHAIVQNLTGVIAKVMNNDERFGGGPLSDTIIPYDEVLPALFMKGFKELTPIPLQTLPEFIICDIDQHIEPYYIDVAESYGLAADVCSRCAAETGVAIDDAFPKFGKAFVTTNMPCNASEATSMFQRRRVNLPDFPVTLAMQHNEPGAHPYSVQVLKDVIKFIEDEYGVKYDWKELFKYAKEINEQNKIELEKWDLFKTEYSPLSGISESLYRLYAWASANGSDPYFTKNDRKVIKRMYDCYERKYKPFGGKTRHRAFLWGPSAVYYTDFPTWVQNCWGINIVLNMDSTMGHNMINTEDPEEAIKDLALFSEKATMRHHAVGGFDNVNAVWDYAKRFNCDMVLFNDNVACKGMNGVHAIMEEQARELGFHFIFIEHDLEDSRTVSRQDMRKCVNDYMSIVLGEKPLDPTLVEFDDSLAY